jgi:hypothetical protein
MSAWAAAGLLSGRRDVAVGSASGPVGGSALFVSHFYDGKERRYPDQWIAVAPGDSFSKAGKTVSVDFAGGIRMEMPKWNSDGKTVGLTEQNNLQATFSFGGKYAGWASKTGAVKASWMDMPDHCQELGACFGMRELDMSMLDYGLNEFGSYKDMIYNQDSTGLTSGQVDGRKLTRNSNILILNAEVSVPHGTASLKCFLHEHEASCGVSVESVTLQSCGWSCFFGTNSVPNVFAWSGESSGTSAPQLTAAEAATNQVPFQPVNAFGYARKQMSFMEQAYPGADYINGKCGAELDAVRLASGKRDWYNDVASNPAALKCVNAAFDAHASGCRPRYSVDSDLANADPVDNSVGGSCRHKMESVTGGSVTMFGVGKPHTISSESDAQRWLQDAPWVVFNHEESLAEGEQRALRLGRDKVRVLPSATRSHDLVVRSAGTDGYVTTVGATAGGWDGFGKGSYQLYLTLPDYMAASQNRAGVKKGAIVRLLAGATTHAWKTGTSPYRRAYEHGQKNRDGTENTDSRVFHPNMLNNDQDNKGIFDDPTSLESSFYALGYPIVHCGSGPAIDDGPGQLAEITWSYEYENESTHYCRSPPCGASAHAGTWVKLTVNGQSIDDRLFHHSCYKVLAEAGVGSPHAGDWVRVVEDPAWDQVDEYGTVIGETHRGDGEGKVEVQLDDSYMLTTAGASWLNDFSAVPTGVKRGAAPVAGDMVSGRVTEMPGWLSTYGSKVAGTKVQALKSDVFMITTNVLYTGTTVGLDAALSAAGQDPDYCDALASYYGAGDCGNTMSSAHSMGDIMTNMWALPTTLAGTDINVHEGYVSDVEKDLTSAADGPRVGNQGNTAVTTTMADALKNAYFAGAGNVVISGHSLGGAKATMLLLMLRANYAKVAGIPIPKDGKNEAAVTAVTLNAAPIFIGELAAMKAMPYVNANTMLRVVTGDDVVTNTVGKFFPVSMQHPAQATLFHVVDRDGMKIRFSTFGYNMFDGLSEGGVCGSHDASKPCWKRLHDTQGQGSAEWASFDRAVAHHKANVWSTVGGCRHGSCDSALVFEEAPAGMGWASPHYRKEM